MEANRFSHRYTLWFPRPLYGASRPNNPKKHMHRKQKTARAVLALLLLPAASKLMAQAAPTTTTSTQESEEVVQLSPFAVTATDERDGYQVKDTLAGTRVRTELKDIASSISVVSKQFMEDTGAKRSEDLLIYTTNTEVGGLRGNFSGAGGSVSYNENRILLRPQENTRVRGLDSADNTRDYFMTDIPWDGYNVDRVDLQRGPNSILFGVGSPAGIVNTSLNGASFKNSNKVETRFGKYDSFRQSIDFNRVFIKNQLALRVAAVYDDTKYQQKPAYNTDKRVFAALRYDPKWFGGDSHTSIKVKFENGNVSANRPRTLPPIDAITPWFKTGTFTVGTATYQNLNKLTLDPTTTWNQYGNNAAYPNSTYPWFREAFMGRLMSSNIAGYYDSNSSGPISVRSPNINTSLGIDSTGAVDGTISGIEFSRPWGISTYNAYARGAIPGGKYYSNVSLSDTSIFDFYNKLMDGNNKHEYQKWQAGNISISHTFLNDRVGFELVYDMQRYQDGQVAMLNGDQYQISVDINSKLMDGTDNPNVGRPYVGNSGQYGNSENYIDRDAIRFTAFGDLRAEDFLKKGLLSKILGHHVFTGVLSQDVKRTDFREFARWASDVTFTEATGQIADITNGARQIDWIAYLGPSLSSASSASGANLNNISATIDPSGYQTVRYHDSHWKATNVDPAAAYTYYTHDSSGALVTNTGTQADNPANYVGWKTGTYKVLSAEKGDIASLYTSGTKARNKISSRGVTWQGYLWEGTVVPVFGWRRDEVKSWGTTAPKGGAAVSLMNYGVDTSDANTKKAAGESKSYGVVVHTPSKFKDMLPLGTNISLFTNKSSNFKADAPRGDVFGNLIDNPKGDTKDYGVVISTLHDKLSLKINWYETKMANATLGADSAGFSSTLYYVWALPYWGATHALAAQDGISNPQLRQGNWGWPWNGIATLADGSPDNTRIQAIIKDFFNNFPLDQHFCDEYGLGMIVSKMKSNNVADWYAAVPTYGVNGQGASALGLQPAYGGNLKSFGTRPVASVDTTSKGVEYELTAQPTKQWSVTLNASKTSASRTAISPTIDAWIATYTKFLSGDAGLIRIWGGDTARVNWANNVLAPYQVQIGRAHV